MPLNVKPPSTKPEKNTSPSSRQTLYGLTLDVSFVVLTTLSHVARAAPVPYLQQAATLALGILTIIQNTKDCREGFKRLASDSCGLVYAITAHPAEKILSTGMGHHVEELVGTLTSIHTLAKKQLTRHPLRRMVQHCSDRGKIIEYREALKQSLDIFGLKLMISICDNITSVIHKQDELAKQIQEQKSQYSDLKGLLTEVLERGLDEKKASAPTPSSPSPPIPDHASRNPFLKYCSNPRPIHTALLGHPPQFHITGNYVLRDASHTIRNTNSGNTTITNISDSHNDSSVKIIGRGRYSHSSF